MGKGSIMIGYRTHGRPPRRRRERSRSNKNRIRSGGLTTMPACLRSASESYGDQSGRHEGRWNRYQSEPQNFFADVASKSGWRSNDRRLANWEGASLSDKRPLTHRVRQASTTAAN